MERNLSLLSPFEHHFIERFHRMSNIREQYESNQTSARPKIFIKVGLPILLQRHRHFGVAIPRQINEPCIIWKTEEINQLGPTRRFAGSGKLFLPSQGVDRA